MFLAMRVLQMARMISLKFGVCLIDFTKNNLIGKLEKG